MVPNTRILRLTKHGMPTAWISWEDAAVLYVKNLVLWTLGSEQFVLHGGQNRQRGTQSILEIAPIIACDGDVSNNVFAPALENSLLFRRDHHRCMYCGNQCHDHDLSRDHILPRSRGGRDAWTNVVTACRRCNHHKGCRTPEEAGMELLAIPFEPNVFEFMYLANRQIRGDQMEYLSARFSGRRSWNRQQIEEHIA